MLPGCLKDELMERSGRLWCKSCSSGVAAAKSFSWFADIVCFQHSGIRFGQPVLQRRLRDLRISYKSVIFRSENIEWAVRDSCSSPRQFI